MKCQWIRQGQEHKGTECPRPAEFVVCYWLLDDAFGRKKWSCANHVTQWFGMAMIKHTGERFDVKRAGEVLRAAA